MRETVGHYRIVRKLGEGGMGVVYAAEFLTFRQTPLFYVTQTLSRLGRTEMVAATLERAVTTGYYCYPAFPADPWLDPLRGDHTFEPALDFARARHERRSRLP